MQRNMVRAWDGGIEFRMNTSAVGLLSVRVAAAAERARTNDTLNERDEDALRTVAADLREEARVLRGEAAPDLNDETAYAVAGVTLTALRLKQTVSPPNDDAASHLDALADTLEKMADGGRVASRDIARVAKLFLAVSELVSRGLGRSGELLEGVPEGTTGASA